MQWFAGCSPHLTSGGDASAPGAPPSGQENERIFSGPVTGRLLIVEDNWVVAIEMEAALLDAGYDVLGIAVSANEAVDVCDRERPDMVLMDIRLQGGSDGVAAAVEIRERFGISSVFVSAHDDPETRARAAAAKPLGWIPKPVTSSELIKRLAGLKRDPS
jgi:two-component system, response regulator PdtaR